MDQKRQSNWGAQYSWNSTSYQQLSGQKTASSQSETRQHCQTFISDYDPPRHIVSEKSHPTNEFPMSLPNPSEHRSAEHPIETIFLNRWSPRAMSGDAVSDEEMAQLFEAARWAPSSYNEQEWRFLYAKRDTEHWNTFFDLLMEANQSWCANAGALIVVCSTNNFTRNGKPNGSHTLDTGMATQNLLLQASTMGLVAHPMAGFNRTQTRASLQVPETATVECMIAIGRPGTLDDLPEALRENEVPTGRKPISEFTTQGPYSFE